MRKVNKTIFAAVLVVLTSVTGMAQFGASSASVTELVRRIQTDTNNLRYSIQNASDRGNYQVSDLIRLMADFDAATVQFDRRLSSRRATASDARLLLDRATPIDSFFRSNRIGAGTMRNWQTLRSDLDLLSQAYNLNWQWPNDGSTSSNPTNLSDAQLRQLVQRINNRTTTFSRSLRVDLDRTNISDRSSRDEARRQLISFESSVVQLRNRVNTRLISSSDVYSLLQPASSLNNFIENRQLSYQTENNWNTLRTDLERLASAYNVAWNWSNPGGGGSGYPRSGDLTGTYRLSTTQSDDARRAVDEATRNLSLSERQRVYDALLRRLDSPQMLAIDRQGNSVTIASTRAPQISFVADGREQVETTQSGRTVRVKAQLSGDQLSITRSGDRANDFVVNFDVVDNGQRLLVTRTLYSERITQPVTVRSYYDRSSDVAQLNIYDTNREYPSGSGGAGDTVGSFGVPNGTQLVAVLNNGLSTQNGQENQRFTMTVRSPGQYEGATIEGNVTSVNRSGRITGRSEMTLDFDTIRLRDGRSYRFAGILESVRTTEGEVVRVDNEGAIRESDQTNKTVTRTAIGTAVGAIIGAIAGGGKGAAIGAVIGAGAGAGSVYVQGPNDLELDTGTEVTVRATGPSPRS
jgi:hypothetical protein